MVEELGGFVTENWRLPPEVVGHNVSYGNPAETIDSLEDRFVWPSGGGPSNPITSASANQAVPFQDFNVGFAQADCFAAPGALAYGGGLQFGMGFGQQGAPMMNSHHTMVPARHQVVMPPAHFGNQYPTTQYSDSQLSEGPIPPNHYRPNHYPPGHFSPGNLQPGHYSQGQFPPDEPSPDRFSPDEHSSDQDSPPALDSRTFGAPAGAGPHNRRPRPMPTEVQFGSDTGFNRLNFVPRSQNETSDAMIADQLATLGCLHRNDSAAPTRAPSPISWAPHAADAISGSSTAPFNQPGPTPYRLPPSKEPSNSESPPPTKRRKSSRAGEAKAVVDPKPAETRRRKVPKTPSPEAEAAAAGGKRAKGSKESASRKGARANLTDHQKRNNHIASEQKRRNVIKDGYQMLDTLVPGLAVGGYSKSIALGVTADWVQTLVVQNQRLREVFLSHGGTFVSQTPVAVA